MNYSSRFFLYAPFALLLLLAAIAGGTWWMAASKVADALEAVNGHDIVPGVKITFASKRIAGFPFRLDVTLEHLTIEARNSNGPLSWTMEHFAAHALTYGREQMIFEAAGKQALQWVNDDGVPRGLAFITAASHASLIQADGKIARFDLDVIGFNSAALDAERLQIHLRHNPAPDALDLDIAGDDIQLSPQLQSRFGATVEKLRLDGRFLPGAAFAPLLAGQKGLGATLDAWRSQVGRFVLNGMEISLGALHGAGSGQLALDAQRRPLGVITLHVANAGAVANAPKAPSSDPGMGTALSELAAKRTNTDRFDLTAPILFRDGQIFVGQFPAGAAPVLY